MTDDELREEFDKLRAEVWGDIRSLLIPLAGIFIAQVGVLMSTWLR